MFFWRAQVILLLQVGDHMMQGMNFFNGIPHPEMRSPALPDLIDQVVETLDQALTVIGGGCSVSPALRAYPD